MTQTSDKIRSSFVMKPTADGKSIEVIENFEMTNDYKDLVVVPYFKQKFRVIPHNKSRT